MKISRDGILSADPGDPPLTHVPTRRTSPLQTIKPLALVQHWTASGADDTRGHRDSLALARWIADPRSDAKASWHVLIDRDGTVIQSASFTVGTWHVGKGGTVEGHVSENVNLCTIGLELENLGQLHPDGEGLCAWPFGARAPHVGGGAATRLVAADGSATWWHSYTAAQEASFEKLARALVTRFGWKASAFRYGHVDFDSPRKIDPGPLWLVVRERVLARVFLGGGA